MHSSGLTEDKRKSAIWPEGSTGCPLRIFLLRLTPFMALGVLGLVAAALIPDYGPGSTRLGGRFNFGFRAVFEFILVAFGAGAFFTGFLRYILDIRPARETFNLALVLGFICYTGALLMAFPGYGQPLRAWFTLKYANPGSMLTLAGFSFTLCALILCIQYSSLLLGCRTLAAMPPLARLRRNLRLFMPLFAALGAFTALFHQGAAGGMFGILSGRPFAFREGFFVWPWTFFLFILSAMSAGLMFTILVGSLTGKVSRRELVSRKAQSSLGRIAGSMLGIYILFKMLDTLWWAVDMIPRAGLSFERMFHGSACGFWLLALEIGPCGAIPALLLIGKRTRERPGLLHLAGILTCLGMCINRYTLVIQTEAQPVLPFDAWELYAPSLAEWTAAGLVVAYGVILFSLSCRYLPIFTPEEPVAGRDGRG
ncbi:MAG: molybdopterin oxidoreductase [Deltaproteobacteria bacterium]|jgi:molybdopterin-containing oxidoreductase family membrane subunit|nr:molybdopterin oxidoreductase [Deltaproteobacteria bacterium]